MGVFGEEFGIDHHTAVGHPAEVEDFGQVDVEGAELGDDEVEVDAPDGFLVLGADNAYGVHAVEGFDET